MPDNSTPLLLAPGKISGHIRYGQHWNVKSITKPDKSSCLVRSINIKAPGKDLGLVCDNSDTSPVKPGKTYNNILSKVLMGLKNLTIIYK